MTKNEQNAYTSGFHYGMESDTLCFPSYQEGAAANEFNPNTDASLAFVRGFLSGEAG